MRLGLQEEIVGREVVLEIEARVELLEEEEVVVENEPHIDVVSSS
jgi:hypothetical protein